LWEDLIICSQMRLYIHFPCPDHEITKCCNPDGAKIEWNASSVTASRPSARFRLRLHVPSSAITAKGSGQRLVEMKAHFMGKNKQLTISFNLMPFRRRPCQNSRIQGKSGYCSSTATFLAKLGILFQQSIVQAHQNSGREPLRRYPLINDVVFSAQCKINSES
jgi:hypothetical protein